MWQQVYTPVEGNLGLSALVAAIPIFVLVYTLGIQKMPSWKASLIAQSQRGHAGRRAEP